MVRFSSAVAACSAGEDGVEALLGTEVSIVAPISAAIAAPPRIHIFVFIRASGTPRNRQEYSQRIVDIVSLCDSPPEIAGGGIYPAMGARRECTAMLRSARLAKHE
jgi:hypothetical protein